MVFNLPIALTWLRIVLIPVFVAVYYLPDSWLSPVAKNWTAMSVFAVAAITDWLDGFLARRWHVEGAFGRVVDPFVDKVLVLGSFIFFAGKNFIIPESVTEPTSTPLVVKTLTGVAPGIVVILLARELLVTTIRSLSERTGQSFGAAFSGKLKMVFQSITILVILVYVNYRRRLIDGGYLEWATTLRDLCIWATVAITVISGLMYLRRAPDLYRVGMDVSPK